jgi:peptidoglycan/xylan/chitin deacetylase (PgdA/CDA1 family)
VWRLPLSLLSPGGRAARLTILIFHRVLPQHDPLNPDEPSAPEFERRMQWVRTWFNVLPLADAAQRLADGTLPPRALAITFDDGYADNREVAAPILRRLGLTATFFITTGFLDGGCMWNDRVIEAVRSCDAASLDLSALGLGSFGLDDAASRRRTATAVLKAIKHLRPPARQAATDAVVHAAGGRPAPALMMSVDQLRELRTLGMHVGAHTITHPILARSTEAEALREIAAGKAQLEALLGEPVSLFAYPNGVPGADYLPEHVRMVRDVGFGAAVSTAWGAASAASDRFQLPRFTPWDRSRWRFGARLLANLRRPAAALT